MAGRSKELEIAIKIAGKVDSSLKTALGAAAKGIGAVANVLGSVSTAAASAAVSMGTAAVDVGKEFEAAMSSLAATADIDIGSEKYERLEKAAREMGKATSKTAAESADALQYMALAGWGVEDSIKGLPSILYLSEASGMDLAQTSDMVTDTMSALGVSIDQLPDYLDVVAKAQNTTNQSAEDLMQAYLGVGGTLKSLGVSTRESAAALGVLANRGTKGSEAGTALNAIMVNLTTKTGQAGKAMESLGISAFDSEGKFIGLKATLEKVNKATREMTQEERNAAFAAIGGKQYLDDLQKLMAGLNDTTADGKQEWEAIAEGLDNAGNALENMRNRKVDNLAGDIDVIKSAVSELGIAVHKDMNGPLRGMVQLGTRMINRLSDAYGEGGIFGMAGAVGDCLKEAADVVADHGPRLIAIGYNVFFEFIDGIVKNAGALADAAAKILPILINRLQSFGPDLFFAAADIMLQFCRGITSEIPDIMQYAAENIYGVVTQISKRLPEISATALALVQALVSGIVEQAPDLIEAWYQLVQNLEITIIQMLPAIVRMGMQLIAGLAEGVLSNLPYILQTAVLVVASLVEGFTQMLPVIIQTGIQLIISLIQGIISNLGNIVQAAVEIVVSLASGLLQAIPQLMAAVPELIWAIIEGIMETDWLQVGIDIITGIIKGILNTGKSLWNAIKSLVTGGGADMDLSGSGKKAVQSYTAGIWDSAPAVSGAADAVYGAAFQGMDFGAAMEAGENAGAAFSTGLAGRAASPVAGARMAALGREGADAMRQGMASGTAGAGADTGSLIDPASLRAGMAEAGKSGASAFRAGFSTGLDEGILPAGSGGMADSAQTAASAAADWNARVNSELDAGWEKAQANARTAMRELAETVRAAAHEAAQAVKAAFEDMTITIPKPKVPAVSVSSSTMPCGGGGSISVPKIAVNWNAAGGIFQKPAVFSTSSGLQGAGEAGPEALLPLDTLWTKLEDVVSLQVRENSGESAASILLGKLQGIRSAGGDGSLSASAGGEGIHIQYSPVYNLHGNAGKEEIAEAAGMSQKDFERRMGQWLKAHRRERF